MEKDILEKLDQILVERKTASPDSSYVASLYDKGIDKILKKIGEEAAETIIAGKDGKPEEIIYETADLWFHTMVMLAHHNISSQEILAELARRFGLSGLEEKKQRAE